MLRPLSDLEVAVLTALANGGTLASFKKFNARDTMENAGTKLRVGSGWYALVEGNGKDRYRAAWFKADKDRTLQLIERYQSAVKAALDVYWSIREGKAPVTRVNPDA